MPGQDHVANTQRSIYSEDTVEVLPGLRNGWILPSATLKVVRTQDRAWDPQGIRSIGRPLQRRGAPSPSSHSVGAQQRLIHVFLTKLRQGNRLFSWPLRREGALSPSFSLTWCVTILYSDLRLLTQHRD